MTNPKVTVLMSVYNGERYLREAIDSILNQIFKDFEFLIINDGSTDGTAEILQSYHDPRIKIINNEKNMGLTKSLNKGLRIAKGEYIARQDADDVSLPQRLEKEVAFLDQNKKVGLVCTNYVRINEKGKVLHRIKCLTEDEELKEKLLETNLFPHGLVMFRAECIEKVGLYREEFKSAQDYDLWLRISEVYDMANIPQLLYKYRLNIKSISVTRKKQQDKYALLAIELAKERRQFGKDKLQTLSKQEIESLLDNLIPKSVSQSRKDLAQGYLFWSKILFSGKDYWGALKLLVKSFINNPLYKKTWTFILKTLILFLFPKPLVNILKLIKRSLLPRNQLSSKRKSKA